MNIQDYISSGVLEAYVMGELSDIERAEVEKNLEQYPALREELALVEDTHEAMLMKVAIMPQPSVKTNLMSKIDAAKPGSAPVELSRAEHSSPFWRYAAAAAVTIAVISSYLAYDYYGKWRKTENSLSDLLAQNDRIAQDYNTVNQRLTQIENDLGVTNNPDFRRVVMKGTPSAPASIASVYWNETTKEVYLSIQDMKQLTAENQYQLWAIIDGKPVNAGVFDSNFSGLLKMKEIGAGASTFAVTIEPRGGNQSPTLETMQVAGNVVEG